MVERRRFLNLPDRTGAAAFLLSLFLVLVGSRAALISHAASPTPFLDEWEADGARLLKPYLRGELRLSDLFVPLNEHLIVFTKLFVLSIFNISGYWDVVLQMIANAILDAATVIAVGYALSRVLTASWAVAAMILSTGLNALPFGFDNAVLGFNTHFYLLLTFSFAALWFLTDSRAWSPRWAAGALCGVGSFLCMASGALTLAACAGAHLLQMACGRRAGPREWLGVAALVAVTVVLLRLIPHVPEADEFRAHSVAQFLTALVALMSWPAHTSLGLIIFLPSALFSWRALADRPALADPRWFNVMALGWVASQMVALAVGRALLPLQTRYFDTLLVGVTISLVSAFWLFQRSATRQRPMSRRALALAAWLSFLALSLTHPQRHLPDKIEEWRRITATGAKNVQLYLATGNPSFLAGAPAVEVPSFDPGRLKQLLDSPEIRSTLPPELVSRDPPRPWVEAFKQGFLRLGYVWLAAGALLLAAVIARAEFMLRKFNAHDRAGDRLAN